MERHERGEKVVSIANSLYFSRTTVSTIVQDKSRILQYLKSTKPVLGHKIISGKRGPIFHKMENLLSLFIARVFEDRIPLSTALIQQKALSLFEDLKPKFPEVGNAEFYASSG